MVPAGTYPMRARGKTVLTAGGSSACEAYTADDAEFIAAEMNEIDRLRAVNAELLEALQLAQTWLANSVPTAAIDGPTPLPVIAAAIAKATEVTP